MPLRRTTEDQRRGSCYENPAPIRKAPWHGPFAMQLAQTRRCLVAERRPPTAPRPPSDPRLRQQSGMYAMCTPLGSTARQARWPGGGVRRARGRPGANAALACVLYRDSPGGSCGVCHVRAHAAYESRAYASRAGSARRACRCCRCCLMCPGPLGHMQ